MADFRQGVSLFSQLRFKLLKLPLCFLDICGTFGFELFLRSSAKGFNLGGLLRQLSLSFFHAVKLGRSFCRVCWVRRSDSRRAAPVALSTGVLAGVA